jgi:hypothetical protein
MNLMETDITNFWRFLTLLDSYEEDALIKSAAKAVQYLDFKNYLNANDHGDYGTIIGDDVVKEALSFIETETSELEKYLILRLALLDLDLPVVGRMCGENGENKFYDNLELYICMVKELNEYSAIQNNCSFSYLEHTKKILERVDLEKSSEEFIDEIMNEIKACEDEQQSLRRQSKE